MISSIYLNWNITSGEFCPLLKATNIFRQVPEDDLCAFPLADEYDLSVFQLKCQLPFP